MPERFGRNEEKANDYGAHLCTGPEVA